MRAPIPHKARSKSLAVTQQIEARIAMTARSRVLTPSPTALDLL
jgi:hypothetical protein